MLWIERSWHSKDKHTDFHFFSFPNFNIKWLLFCLPSPISPFPPHAPNLHSIFFLICLFASPSGGSGSSFTAKSALYLDFAPLVAAKYLCKTCLQKKKKKKMNGEKKAQKGDQNTEMHLNFLTHKLYWVLSALEGQLTHLRLLHLQAFLTSLFFVTIFFYTIFMLLWTNWICALNLANRNKTSILCLRPSKRKINLARLFCLLVEYKCGGKKMNTLNSDENAIRMQWVAPPAGQCRSCRASSPRLPLSCVVNQRNGSRLGGLVRERWWSSMTRLWSAVPAGYLYTNRRREAPGGAATISAATSSVFMTTSSMKRWRLFRNVEGFFFFQFCCYSWDKSFIFRCERFTLRCPYGLCSSYLQPQQQQ